MDGGKTDYWECCVDNIKVYDWLEGRQTFESVALKVTIDSLLGVLHWQLL